MKQKPNIEIAQETSNVSGNGEQEQNISPQECQIRDIDSGNSEQNPSPQEQQQTTTNVSGNSLEPVETKKRYRVFELGKQRGAFPDVESADMFAEQLQKNGISAVVV